jgi:hypothetical protein
MALQRTTRAGLTYAGAYGDLDWHRALANALVMVDAANAVGALAARAAAIGGPPGYAPSGLDLAIAPGSFIGTDGVPVAYAGATVAMTASATRRVWLTPAGAVATGASWPTTAHYRLATVVAGSADITSITDERVGYVEPGARTIDAATTLDASYRVCSCDATAGAFTVTLPPAADCPGRQYRIAKVDAGGNAVTVAADGSDTIEGSATVSLSAIWNKLVCTSDGARWIKF